MSEYQFRCTTNRLLHHRREIQESGDTVLHQNFLGGRDWVLTCQKAEDDEPAQGPFDGAIDRSKLLQAVELVTGRPADTLRSVRFQRDVVEVVEFALDDEGRKQVTQDGKAILTVSRYGVAD